MLSCMCNMDRGVVFVQKNNEIDEICCISCTILCVLFKKSLLTSAPAILSVQAHIIIQSS